MTYVIMARNFPPDHGGIQSAMRGLARRLAGDAPVIVLGSTPFDAAAEPFDFIAAQGGRFRERHAARRLLKTRLQGETPIFICDNWHAVKAVPMGNHPIVVLAHGSEYRRPRAARLARAAARTTHLIANSADTFELVAAQIDLAAIPSTIIPPTYDLPEDIAAPRPKAPDAPYQLVSICRLEPHKGLRKALDVLAARRADLPDFVWHIAGGGSQKAELRQAAEGFGDKIIFHEPIDEPRKDDLLQQADLFVMPSYGDVRWHEGFGISYIEAARHGVPAIAGASRGIRDAVRDGKTGWCVDAQDPDVLFAALHAALTDDALRQKLGRNAQAAYKARFAGDIVAERFRAHIRGNAPPA